MTGEALGQEQLPLLWPIPLYPAPRRLGCSFWGGWGIPTQRFSKDGS